MFSRTDRYWNVRTFKKTKQRKGTTLLCCCYLKHVSSTLLAETINVSTSSYLQHLIYIYSSCLIWFGFLFNFLYRKFSPHTLTYSKQFFNFQKDLCSLRSSSPEEEVILQGESSLTFPLRSLSHFSRDSRNLLLLPDFFPGPFSPTGNSSPLSPSLPYHPSERSLDTIFPTFMYDLHEGSLHRQLFRGTSPCVLHSILTDSCLARFRYMEIGSCLATSCFDYQLMI